MLAEIYKKPGLSLYANWENGFAIIGNGWDYL
jgi:hypothetical protein